jgi:Flp pilus assembly protein CpaB
MEMEFKDRSRRRRFMVVIGVVLALVAGGAAFALSSQGAGQAQAQVEMRTILVAAREIPARTVLTASDLTLRELPKDSVVTEALDDPANAVGQVTGVPIFLNQPITPNLLATGAVDAAFSILGPDEPVEEDSPVWRAVSVAIPPERAVAGHIQTGQRVDLIASVQLDILNWDPVENAYTGNPTAENGFVSGKTTKVTFEDVLVLNADSESEMYVLKVDLNQAEEISHLQTAEGTFAIALRPEADTRPLDRTQYGETTDRIVEQYRFVVPKILDLVALDADQPAAPDEPPAEPPAGDTTSP